jgi:outer membrane lipopolysaccharide assembly protein LptE/RlpB
MARQMTRRSPYSIEGLIYLIVLGMAGCGYQFAGRSELFPKDVRTVYVEPFLNRTREIGIEHEMTTALRSELYRRGELQVVDQADQADAILSGVVRTFDSTTASVNRNNEVLQYESVMNVEVSFRRREPAEILWRGQDIRHTALNAVTRAADVTNSSEILTGALKASDVRRMTDIQLTETANRQVRENLIERFARELHQRLMEMF